MVLCLLLSLVAPARAGMVAAHRDTLRGVAAIKVMVNLNDGAIEAGIAGASVGAAEGKQMRVAAWLER